MSNVLSLSQLVAHLEQSGMPCELRGEQNVKVDSVAPLHKAVQGQLGFLSDDAYKKDLATTQASVVLIKPDLAELCPVNAILVKNPYAAYALCAQALYKQPFKKGIHETAVVHPSVKLPQNIFIGAYAVIEEKVVLGDQVTIESGCVIQSGVSIGANTHLHPGVTVMHDCVIGEHCHIKSGAVIGGDGFGWAKHQGKWIKIPQIGRVIIGNNVAIGSNSTVDRGAIEDTVIEDHCIIDNLVHLAHNVHFGTGGAMAAFTGISGSTNIGSHCTFAGQTATAGHVDIADNVTLMGRAAVTHSIHKPGTYAGLPAMPIGDWQKSRVHLKNLSKLSDKVKSLNKRVADLEKTD